MKLLLLNAKVRRIAIALTFALACKGSQSGYPVILDFSFLLIDSSTVASTKQIQEGTPFALVYFDPDCHDCQKETEEILENINKLSDVRIYFITDVRFERLKVFNRVYKIKNYSNIVLGRDFSQSFYKLYKPGGTPYTMIFDKKKRLRSVFSGQANIKDFINVMEKLK